MNTLISIINFFCYPLLRIYWRVFKPKTEGVKICIVHNNNVLFVQHSYGFKEWTIPGGGIKHNEKQEEAARREAKEEVGITLDTVTYKGSFLHTDEWKQNTVHVFLAPVLNLEYKIDDFEIRAASWEPLESLTLSESPIARKCLQIAGIYLNNPLY